MTSKPLFIIVAESIVMRWPMTQVGCLSACAGVICSNAESGVDAEWSSRGGEPDLPDFAGGSAPHALVHGVVFGIDGQQGNLVFFGCSHDELASCDEALLVRQADGLAGFHRGVGGVEPGYTHDRRNDEIDLRQRGYPYGAGRAVDDLNFGDAVCFEP